MTVLPVVGRELQSAARLSFTYYLRVAGAAAALAACLLFGLSYGFHTNGGGLLFRYLHVSVFCAIWIFVPLLTADCISRERRERTLGLLFLTQLKAPDIIVAKGLAHVLRAFTLWLAVIPVAIIPVLLGGLSGREAVGALLVHFACISWALAAGLLASAWSKSWLRAMTLAFLLAGFFLLAFGAGTGGLLLRTLPPARGMTVPASSPGVCLAAGLGLLLDPTGEWLGFVLRRASPAWVTRTIAEAALLSGLVFVSAIVVAGWGVRQASREEPPPPWVSWWTTAFCTPVVGVSVLRWWMRRKLTRNPVGWLEERTWNGRLVTWGWLAVIISIYSAGFSEPNVFRQYNDLQRGIAWLMAGSVALSAATSFQRERESGLMELLLVSPLRASDIIWGRLRGLWGQFLPSFGLLLGVWAYLTTIPYFGVEPSGAEFGPLLFFGVAYLTLPVVGLYFSLRCHNLVAAFLATLVAGLFGPLLVTFLVAWALRIWYLPGAPIVSGLRFSPLEAACQLGVAAWCWQRLCQCLQRRAFPLDRRAR